MERINLKKVTMMSGLGQTLQYRRDVFKIAKEPLMEQKVRGMFTTTNTIHLEQCHIIMAE